MLREGEKLTFSAVIPSPGPPVMGLEQAAQSNSGF